MGACDFTAVGRGPNAEKAYRNAVEEAEYEHGHDGYNGTISTSRGFYEITGKSLLSYSKALREAIKAKKAEIKGKVYQFSYDKESDAYRISDLESTAARVMAARKTEDKAARAWAMLEAEMALEDGKRIEKWGPCACVKVEPGKYYFSGIAAC